MRNLKPLYILLAGSALVSALTFIALLILNYYEAIDIRIILILPITIGLLTYIVFYFFIKRFITKKLKILYRSIRKGKFDDSAYTSFRINEDVIETAELETKKWAEERFAEIYKLKEQEKFRKEFLGNLAHELKTPVFSIQGYILTLLEGGLEDENVNRMFLERASKATDRMTAILDDLDQITRIEVDQLALDITRFNIKELVEEIFDASEVKAKAKLIELKFAKAFDAIHVNADRSKIGQVLMNIIRNSISYGNEGGQTEVRFYVMDDIVTVEVSDNGPGIAESEIPRLFERFYRVEKSRNRHEGGSGLGLAIAKHIVEAHGQTINVRSTPGIGSTFTFGLDKG